MKLRWLALAALLSAPVLTGLEIPHSVLERLRHLPIQHQGRHKPFDSFAREALIQMTGQDHIKQEVPVVSVLSMAAAPEQWQNFRLLSVPYGPLRLMLGLSRKQARVSLVELLATRQLMRALPPIVEKQQRDEPLTMLEQETWDLYQRFALFNAILEQRFELVPAVSGSWSSITDPQGLDEASRTALGQTWTAMLAAVKAEQMHELSGEVEELAVQLGC